jgi:IS5 family transposase
MSHQLTFADMNSALSAVRPEKRFSSRMEQILPWQNMTAIEPFYPKAGNGRRPYPLETMLRIHCMQHWYNLSDGAMEDALYEIASMRLFARLSLDSALPDRTTIMNFRHLLEQHQLARQLFKTINRWLAEAGVMMTKALWWMPPSLRHPALPRTKSSNAIRRCIRPRKAISGTLA